MQSLSILSGGGALRVLAVGAHADDIEIGCGGTVLRLASQPRDVHVTWVVFCGTGERAAEARDSAAAFLEGTLDPRVIVRDFRDGFLPHAGAALKEEFEALKRDVRPDVVFTHFREDRHQDHRAVSELTWNTWRNHLILEYEIPKYDGDFGSPNVFSPLTAAAVERKLALVFEHFRTQAQKHWFQPELLRGVARIRGMECVAPEAYAEAFYGRKVVW
jgi:LmbE family N-acetylglucosaminyl deacetylase